MLSPQLINVSGRIQLPAANGHCEHNDLNTGITKAVQPTPPNVRIMASGGCTAVVRSGRRKFPCDCPRGIFNILPGAQGDPECQECAHPLSQHKDVSSTPAQDSSQSKLPTINFLAMASE
jgi:hypothetical protein